MIEKLKSLEAGALPRPWFAHPEEGVQVLEQKDADFVCALRNLSPELIALWEIDNLWLKESKKFHPSVVADIHRARKVALKALNAKAKEVL